MDAFNIIGLRPGQALPDLGPARPLRVVIVADTVVDREWRFGIAKSLIQTGCVYAIAWGVDCEGWEDCIDWAYLDKVELQDGPDEEFVMTTSHQNESLYEALWFSIYSASHPDVMLEETLIIQIGERFDPTAIRETYQRAVLDQG